jgi:hypothetical protein
MLKIIRYKYVLLLSALIIGSCGKEYLELEPRGTTLETNFYQTEEEIFEALVATYDVLQWSGTDGWTMKLGLLNAASDECFAGGSDASDQPSWVAFDQFTLDPFLGPQLGLWNKGFSGIYRANLVLQKLEEGSGFSDAFVARTAAEAKFLRAYFYFDLVRLFENVPLITKVLSADEIYEQVQAPAADVYAQIEQDLSDARNTFELPATLPPDEFGRVTQGAVTALLGKVILYQNNDSRMLEAGSLFEEVINSGIYALEPDFGNIFHPDNEFGIESIFEIQYSGNFIRKYAGLQQDRATDGEPALNWKYNIRDIRLADVLLMAAEAFARGGDEATAKTYLNQVRSRVNLQPFFAPSGAALLDVIYKERFMELATEGHRYFDLVRTGRASSELGDQGFTAGKNEVLPIPQTEIDISEGKLVQNPGY